MACATLPAGSLDGAIALILRGVCTFEQKLNNAQQAGASAALVYTDESRPDPIPMSTGGASLPAQMVSYNDGIAIKQGLPGGTTATLDFALHANYTSPDSLAEFSSMGPNIDGGIKPDLVAVGTNIYTAAQKLDSAGELYDPSGYGVFDGTSFSAPLVSGAAALVKAARPGLTAAQYKSLLVNNTGRISAKPGSAASAQEAGAGALDVSAALRATAAMEPVSLSFGVGGAGTLISKNLIVTNVGTARETFLISALPESGVARPDGIVEFGDARSRCCHDASGDAFRGGSGSRRTMRASSPSPDRPRVRRAASHIGSVCRRTPPHTSPSSIPRPVSVREHWSPMR